MSKKSPPVDRLQEDNVTAAIWRRDKENGPEHRASFDRSYQDQEGRYHNAYDYGPSDLENLGKLIPQAQTRIQELDLEAGRDPAQDQQKAMADDLREQSKAAQAAPQQDLDQGH